MLRIGQMDHIVLNVSNIDASLHFYADVLGLEAERVDDYKSGKIGFPSVRINDQTIIDLFPPERQEGPVSGGRSGNLNHLCLATENDDMDAVVTYLNGHGIAVETGPIRRWGAKGNGTSVYFRDPDNNLVEVRTYAAVAQPAGAGAAR